MSKLFLHGRSGTNDNQDPRAKLTVNCPSGATIRVDSPQSVIALEATSGPDGKVVFNKLTAGSWNVKVVNLDNITPQKVEITTLDYEITMKYFESFIRVIYPAGSKCKITKGGLTLNAPDTSGSWTCKVEEAGTYTVNINRTHSLFGYQSVSGTVDITSTEQTKPITLSYFESYVNATYPTDSKCSISNGDDTYHASGTTGKYKFAVPRTGTWTVNINRTHEIYGYQSVSGNVEITATGQTKDISLTYFEAFVNVTYPAGSTCKISNGDATYTAPNTTGTHKFGVPRTGTWKVTISRNHEIFGPQSVTKDVVINATGQNESVSLKYFEATVNATYPAGSTCYISSGSERYNAVGTGGTYAFKVPHTGTWTVHSSREFVGPGNAKPGYTQTDSKTATINSDGQTTSVTLKYFEATLNVTYPAETYRILLQYTNGWYVYGNVVNGGGSSSLILPRTGEFQIEARRVPEYEKMQQIPSDWQGYIFDVTSDGQTFSRNFKFLTSYINVTYPAGSTCTAKSADGSITRTAPDTTGKWTLLVPRLDTWTIKSTSGSDSASSNVVIDGDNQNKSITLTYNTIPVFTYTGSYQIVNDADQPISTSKDNWKIRFLTSGTLNITQLGGAKNGIDVFCVGGGANGSKAHYGANGGGGGYTKTTKNVSVSVKSYGITIGGAGGATSAFGVSANGGGFNGGSGGGAGGTGDYYGWNKPGGAGGSDGGNGGNSPNANPNPPEYGGKGQGTTTREFGETGGKLYAGGGGGGAGLARDIWQWSSPGAGGSGGGGKGGQKDSPAGKAGTANTGGGGGGGSAETAGGSGGSGIVVIRNAR